ncbi:MAG: hypothetical protein J6L69_07960 [Lachnospiraceae bacterium]|nr:hypothetical protein [Lachnospiraceae bacterium]
MFLNISNHNSVNWSKEQLVAANEFGEIVDYQFPSVKATASKNEIEEISNKIVCEVLELKPEVVMCQGEFTLTYALVDKLKNKNIKVVAACSKRCVEEQIMPDGTVKKSSRFKFIQFREY